MQNEVNHSPENGKKGHQQPLGKKWNLNKIRYGDFFPVFCDGSCSGSTIRIKEKSQGLPSLNLAVTNTNSALSKVERDFLFGDPVSAVLPIVAA